MNTQPETKLTLVSLQYKCRKLSWFVRCNIVNGKAIVPADVHNKMLNVLGCRERGETYTVG